MLWKSLALLVVSLALVASLTGDKKYCATFTAVDAAMAQGYFAMELGGGGSWAKYSFDIETEGSNALDGCKLDDGLKYHIHMKWDSSEDSSADRNNGGVCSKAGPHYDPNYACGTASYYYATKCGDLNRVNTNTYDYDCATEFSKGDYAACEIGDLSGKFGVRKVNSGETKSIASGGYLHDPLPPYAYNFDYDNVAEPGNAWKSVVFHCNTPTKNGVRVLCARFRESTAGDLCHTKGGFEDTSGGDNTGGGGGEGGGNTGGGGGEGEGSDDGEEQLDACANCECTEKGYKFSQNDLVKWVIISIVLTIVINVICACVGWFFEKKRRTRDTVIVQHVNAPPTAPPTQNPVHKL